MIRLNNDYMIMYYLAIEYRSWTALFCIYADDSITGPSRRNIHKHRLLLKL